VFRAGSTAATTTYVRAADAHARKRELFAATASAPDSLHRLGWLTRRIPTSVKRRVPVVRERDALRERLNDCQARLDRERADRLAIGGLRGTYVGDSRMLVATTWGGRLFVPSTDLSLMPELVAYGTYDVPFTAFVQRHIKPGDTVIDVGASVGLFTLLFAYQVWEHGHVIAYEANPPMVELLRDNVTMGWLSDRVEIVPKAAAATTGVLPFLAPSRYSMTGSLRPVEHLLSTEDRIDTIDTIEVEAEPLDVHVGHFERIDLVKIDVEGAEEQVLAGMEQLLASGAVRRVSFEVSREHIGDDWASFTERLRRKEVDGWAFSTISDSGEPEPIALEDVFERGRFSQVLMHRGTE
jgi:FkbM family methyltransferase